MSESPEVPKKIDPEAPPGIPPYVPADMHTSATQHFSILGNRLVEAVETRKNKPNWINIVLVIIAIVGSIITINNLIKANIKDSKTETEKKIKEFRDEVKEDILEIKGDIKAVKCQISAMTKDYDKRIETRENLTLMIKDISREEIRNFLIDNNKDKRN